MKIQTYFINEFQQKNTYDCLVVLVTCINEEKELLKAILMSMEIPMEKFTKVSSIIDMGYSASQVTQAITESNTFDMEDLLDSLDNKTTGNLKELS